MRSEFQYFMSDSDHAEFDEFILSFPGVTIKTGKSYDEIILLDGFVQYDRSNLSDGILTSGRIAIATTDLDGNLNFTSDKEIEHLYKELRKWLKKKSTNKLACFNEKMGESTLQPTKNFWLCEGAEEMKKSHNIKLKQYVSTHAVFKLA